MRKKGGPIKNEREHTGRFLAMWEREGSKGPPG